MPYFLPSLRVDGSFIQTVLILFSWIRPLPERSSHRRQAHVTKPLSTTAAVCDTIASPLRQLLRAFFFFFMERQTSNATPLSTPPRPVASFLLGCSCLNRRWILADISAKHDAPLSGGGGGNSESGDLSTAAMMAEALRRSSVSSPFSSRYGRNSRFPRMGVILALRLLVVVATIKALRRAAVVLLLDVHFDFVVCGLRLGGWVGGGCENQPSADKPVLNNM